MAENLIRKVLYEHDADTAFGGFDDVGRVYEVRVFNSTGKKIKTISVSDLLERENEKDLKRMRFNATL